MQKLKMHTPNLTMQNLEKIKALFPNCITESQDNNGKLKLAIDFDLLKQELSDSIVEGPQERYQLNWPGKRKALLTANTPIAKTLRPAVDESVDNIKPGRKPEDLLFQVLLDLGLDLTLLISTKTICGKTIFLVNNYRRSFF